MEGTIKAVPIAMVPEYPDWSEASSCPAWLKPVISSTISYRRSKALLPEMKNNCTVYIYIQSQVLNNSSFEAKMKKVSSEDKTVKIKPTISRLPNKMNSQ